jgi:predicted RNA binding protein YcfA (HicA-like mRNA interferase family)
MPRKMRQLIKELEQAGFVNRGGRGNHRNFIHPKGIVITISGKSGDEVKHYQENEVRKKIRESQK